MAWAASARGPTSALKATPPPSLAVDDVDKDGSCDVIAGNNRPSIGVAGSASAWQIDHNRRCAGSRRRSITTDQSLTVKASDDTDVTVGAAASANQTSVGLSAGATHITRTVDASIGDADVGRVAREWPAARRDRRHSQRDPRMTMCSPTPPAAALSRQVGVAASAIANTMNSRTTASIGNGANVNLDNAASAAAQRRRDR